MASEKTIFTYIINKETQKKYRWLYGGAIRALWYRVLRLLRALHKPMSNHIAIRRRVKYGKGEYGIQKSDKKYHLNTSRQAWRHTDCSRWFHAQKIEAGERIDFGRQIILSKMFGLYSWWLMLCRTVICENNR